MDAKWKHGLSIAAERGIAAVDFPDLVCVKVPLGGWVLALVSFSEDYIIVQEPGKYHPLYRVYPLPFEGSLYEFISREIQNPSVPVARDMETIKRLFLKWERIYKTAEWKPLDMDIKKGESDGDQS